jgi:uncharacterized protein with HEPN domain
LSGDTINLRQILDAIAAIEEYAAAGGDCFFAEPLRQDGIILQLINIGESTKRLSSDLRERHPEVAWRSMAPLRDVLVHNYAGVNRTIVWEVTQQRLPGVRREIEAILEVDRRGSTA